MKSIFQIIILLIIINLIFNKIKSKEETKQKQFEDEILSYLDKNFEKEKENYDKFKDISYYYNFDENLENNQKKSKNEL
jgi:hypothetical protein